MRQLTPSQLLGGGVTRLSPLTSTRTTFEDNGDDLYTILRRIDNHLPNDIVNGFPWVSGVFQDRSLVSDRLEIITPIYVAGDANMISGDLFVAREKGIYFMSAGSGQCMFEPTSNGSLTVFISPGDSGPDYNAARVAFAQTHRPALPNASVLIQLNESDTLVVVYRSSGVDQPTISNNGRTNIFTFARVG